MGSKYKPEGFEQVSVVYHDDIKKRYIGYINIQDKIFMIEETKSPLRDFSKYINGHIQTNNPEILMLCKSEGVDARPTEKKDNVTLTMWRSQRERIKRAAEIETGRDMLTPYVMGIVEKYLDEKGL